MLQEYDGLKKKGHKVQIYTTVVDKKKSFPDIIGRYKIKTFLPNISIFKGHEAFQTILSCVLAPFFAYKFRNYDCILACNQPSPWIAFVVKKMFGVPYVSYLAQPTRFLHQRPIDKKTGLFFSKSAENSLSAKLMMKQFKKFSDWADKISIKSSNQILVNGEYSKKLIEKVYKVKSISCPSGVKPAKNVNFKRDKFLLVTNRHFAQKKIEFAIFTLNKLHLIKPDFRLVITGSDSEYTNKLKELTNELGLNMFVDFLGYVNANELIRLYKKSSAYLYTAPEEDFGMGIIEAMNYGTPVIAWNHGGPKYIIDDGVDGYLATPNNLDEFVEKTIKVITDKKTAKKISINARKKIQQQYNFDTHIGLLETALLTSLH